LDSRISLKCSAIGVHGIRILENDAADRVVVEHDKKLEVGILFVIA